MAQLIYKLALSMIAAAIVGAGVCDLVLYLRGEQTISAWLRLNPGWFFWAEIAAAMFLLVLWLHLFVWPEF